MNWRQLLNRLDNRTLKWFNKKVTEEAQRQVSWYKLRCHLCEGILDVSASSEFEAVQAALAYFNWAYSPQEVVPGFERWIYFCEGCKSGV